MHGGTELFAFRPMAETDIPSVVAIQSECYSGQFLEAEPTIRARLQICPDYAWVAEDKNGVCAYLFGYRSIVGKVTALGEVFEISHPADNLYLHDLAASRRVAGMGVGTKLVELALADAVREGLPYSSLVSLGSARGFWSRLGYLDYSPIDTAQASRLASYSEPVWCMLKFLADGN